MSVELVVFDFDGTLCDSAGVKTEAFHELYRAEEGDEFAAAVRAHHEAHAGVSRYDKLREYEAWLGRTGPAARVDELAGRFAALVVERVIAAPMFPGAVDFLERYQGEVPLTVASATPTGELRAIVAAKGLAGYFAAVDGSPEPKAEIVARHLARFGAAPQRAVFVGDQAADHAAARRAGCRFVGFRPDGEAAPFPPGTEVVADFQALTATIGAAAA